MFTAPALRAGRGSGDAPGVQADVLVRLGELVEADQLQRLTHPSLTVTGHA
jgi:hypothetical protein